MKALEHSNREKSFIIRTIKIIISNEWNEISYKVLPEWNEKAHYEHQIGFYAFSKYSEHL